MSRAACTICAKVVSTTCDPNNLEGWFVSLATSEKLEVQLDAHPGLFLRGFFNKQAPRLVLCEDCQELCGKRYVPCIDCNVMTRPCPVPLVKDGVEYSLCHGCTAKRLVASGLLE